jgi:hypothetical protein
MSSLSICSLYIRLHLLTKGRVARLHWPDVAGHEGGPRKMLAPERLVAYVVAFWTGQGSVLLNSLLDTNVAGYCMFRLLARILRLFPGDCDRSRGRADRSSHLQHPPTNR